MGSESKSTKVDFVTIAIKHRYIVKVAHEWTHFLTI